MPQLITPNADLRDLNTLAIQATAAALAQPLDLQQLQQVLDWQQHKLAAEQPCMILGGGSNVVFVDDYPGLIIQPRWRDIQLLDETTEQVYIRVGAGHNWHQLVRWHLQQGYSGLENLALIPGGCGAAPIQNIGAYGVELAERCQQVRVFDLQSQQLLELSTSDCRFAYRDSIFKTSQARHWLIESVVLRLDKQFRPQLQYADLQYLQNEPRLSATKLAAVVCRIRRQKLPEPQQLGNVGSFFKNPLLDAETCARLLSEHPGLPHWPVGQQFKLSAAWLIEQCGWRGKCIGGACVSDKHALVLINKKQATGREIVKLARIITTSVQEKFQITLQIEPKLIGIEAD